MVGSRPSLQQPLAASDTANEHANDHDRGARQLIRERPLPDHYRELEVAPVASPETIKAAYAALARRFHPDRNRQPGAAERMQRINEAYAVLSVPYRRRNYDLERFKAAQPLPEPPAEPAVEVARAAREWGVDLPEPPRTPAAAAPRRQAALVAGWARRAGGAAGAHPLWLAGGAGVGGLLVIVAIVGLAVHGSGGARPAATAAAAGPSVHVVAATTPLAPSPVAATVATVAPTQPPTTHADDVLLALAQRFPPVNALTDASRRPPGADRGWAFSSDGCTVFAGEYDAAERADAARRYWSEQSGRYTYEGSGPVVVAVGDCDAQQHQFEVLNAIADAFARVH